MSGIPYRGGRPDDIGYGGRGGNRWDSDRFASERGSDRFDRGRAPLDSGRGFYEERDERIVTRGGGFGRPRERSVDEIYERRGPGYGDDRYERRHYHDDDLPRYERDVNPFAARDSWDRRESTLIEKERDVYPAPRRGNRPTFLRRQSSLDTFDRKPLTRFVERDVREEYGPPARYRPAEVRPPPMVPIPLPRTRQIGPPPRRGYERDYEDIRVAEPDFYGDDEYRPYPERVREREVIRRRRRSRSRDSIRSRSHRGTSVRSSSISSSSSSDRDTVRSEFPKRGKTRMPARLVSKKAIIALGYPFEEEGDTIIIMKALGRENIDEVIRLSEEYKDKERIVETEQTTYLVGPGADLPSTTVIEDRKIQETIVVPPPPAPIVVPPPAVIPPPPVPVQEVITDTKIVEHHDHGHHHHHHGGPLIVDAHPHHHHHDHVTELTEIKTVEPLALAPIASSSRRDEAAIRAEIRALELEKEALRRRRRGKSVGATDLVLLDSAERFHEHGEEVTIVRKEKIVEPDGGVRIEKDRKGRMAISVPKYYR